MPNLKQRRVEQTQAEWLRDNVNRVLPVIAHAVAVFGDEHKASHWFVTPLPVLADRSPSQVLAAQDGAEIVDRILTRIEHNIPS